MRLDWDPVAVADVKAAVTFATPRWPSAATTIAGEIVAIVERLKDFPMSGRTGSVPGTRELVVARYPFIIVYAVEEDAVTILRLYHQRTKWPASGTLA